MSPPQLAPGVRRVAPQLLVGGTPVRVLRLSPAGSDALDALLAGQLHPGSDALHDRLTRARMLLDPPGPARLDDVTVVIPVRGTDEEVRQALTGVPPGVRVVVVDDGSTPPIALPELHAGRDATGDDAARLAQVQVVWHERSHGPSAARNAGASQTTTDLLAFVDAGVHLPPDALAQLSGHFAAPDVVAVAPRVMSGPAAGAVGVLERQLCALDQGPLPAVVHPRGALSYLPATMLLVRRSALDAVGGFDEALQVGEDVDLVWRLCELGAVRYDPSVVVTHTPRARLRDALTRRRDYGTSAGPLEVRHPGRLRHLRLSTWSVLPWLAAAVHPVAGVATAAALAAAAPRRLGMLPADEARRMAAAAQWAAFAAAGRFAVRPGWPLTLTALTLRRGRRTAPLLGAAYVAGSWPRLRAGPLRDLPLRAVLHVADDLAYSAGVWRSAAATGRWRVLLPGRAHPPPR